MTVAPYCVAATRLRLSGPNMTEVIPPQLVIPGVSVLLQSSLSNSALPTLTVLASEYLITLTEPSSVPIAIYLN